MSDYTIFVKDRGYAFLGGPPLVKMAIDEDVTEQELGGADMHARVSGLADYLAADEADAIRQARSVISRFGRARRVPGGPAPIHDPDELLGIVPEDPKTPFDIREVIGRIVDGSIFDEFKPLYGPNLVTGWSELNGMPIGVLANNGILFSPESQKGAQFIELCNQLSTPILFIQNITGFMVGTAAEKGGIIKDGAKLINAVANSRCAARDSDGRSQLRGGQLRDGRSRLPAASGPDLAHPPHRGDGRPPAGRGDVDRAAAVGASRAISKFDEAADAAQRSEDEARIESESTALYATGRVWDDGIIDPRHSRAALTVAFAMSRDAEPRPRVHRPASASSGSSEDSRASFIDCQPRRGGQPSGASGARTRHSHRRHVFRS